MNVPKVVTLALILNAGFFTASSLAVTEKSPLGVWQVSDVAINDLSGRTLTYESDDDRLVGRFLTLTPDAIATDLPSGAHCQSPSYTQKNEKLDTWITRVFGTGDDANAKNYGLGIAGAEQAVVTTLDCKTGQFTNGDGNTPVDIVFAGNKVLLNWTDGTILSLKAVEQHGKPVASFSCDNAATASEKAICDNPSLASLDVSVSRAWKRYRKEAARLNKSDLQASLISGQKAWLAQRNGCADDKTCLQKSMQDRLEVLSHSLDAF
ncbi:hypothetical protein KXR87_06935 [Yokenella regensburgei]|uniref:lysozyme inhibitor LprI family protein n=1 Tax=Yokenella regensburgei TaxID=158877 RepID=UPI003F191503